MSSIRKDPQRPQADASVPEASNDPGTGGPIDKTNVMKSFYQRELEERDAEIERLSQDNQRLRAKIINHEGDPDINQDTGTAQFVDPAAQKRIAEVNAQLIATFNEEREKFAGEAADAKDRMLRALAELDNVRRRTEREKADISKYAISDFARDVIGLGDDVQRTIDHVPAEAAANDSALKTFLEGVQLMERELLATLERHGVVRLAPQGERFDPNKHQAVMEQENVEVPAGTVVQVLQAGYMIGERTLRPAVVVVSKGGAKVPKPTLKDESAPGEQQAGASGETPPADEPLA